MLSAGRLDKRVTIQQLVAASPDQDAGGEPDEAWTDLKTVWASVEPLKGREFLAKGREFLASRQVNSEVTGQIVIRKRAGITAKMRCSYDSRIYDILSVVDPGEGDEMLILYVREGANAG